MLTSSVRHLLERIADPSAKGSHRALQSEASTAQQLRQAEQVGDEELPGRQPVASCIFEVDILLALPGLALEFSPSVGDFKVRTSQGAADRCLVAGCMWLNLARLSTSCSPPTASLRMPSASVAWAQLPAASAACTQLCCRGPSLQAASMTLTAAAYVLARLPEAAATAGIQPG